MRLTTPLRILTLLLAPVALLGTSWLYLYPIIHGCSFPVPPPHVGTTAPFRLLALGDPQLEGDTSLPDPHAPVFPSLEWLGQDLRHAPDASTRVFILRNAATGILVDIGRWAEGVRKRVDLWGNDWYLAHVVRQTRWWSGPSHVAVLGDLLGSQWVGDGEFGRRGGRFWGKVFGGMGVVPDEIYGIPAEDTGKEEGENKEGEEDGEEKGHEEEKEERNYWGGTTQILGADPSWSSRVINIAGNHDIGYAGDIDEHRIERFERAFGRVNWDIWFTLPNTTSTPDTPDASSESQEKDGMSAEDEDIPALRIIILNSMNLDTPALSSTLQTSTYAFLNHIITTSRPVTSRNHATVLLTHIPLEKEAGVCVDAPFFSYFDDGSGVKEQNMLSGHSSRGVLEGIFGLSKSRGSAGGGMGRGGVVLNGHDHEGCDVLHFVRQDPPLECHLDDVKDDDAYWPDPIPTPRPTYETRESQPTSPANILLQAFCLAMHILVPPPPAAEEDESPWSAHPFPPRKYHVSANNSTCTHIPSAPQLREITLRSMMGDFGGYAGFLSAWYDRSKGEDGEGEWVFEFNSCGLGVQHWWWGVHILDLVVLGALAATLVARALEGETGERRVSRDGKENGKM